MVHGAIWENGKLTEVGDLGGGLSEFWDINNKGQAVGDSIYPNGDSHSILYENGQLIDLNDRISADAGWVLLSAVGINERGQIAGTGFHNGLIRAYILTPKK